MSPDWRTARSVAQRGSAPVSASPGWTSTSWTVVTTGARRNGSARFSHSVLLLSRCTTSGRSRRTMPTRSTTKRGFARLRCRGQSSSRRSTPVVEPAGKARVAPPRHRRPSPAPTARRRWRRRWCSPRARTRASAPAAPAVAPVRRAPAIPARSSRGHRRDRDLDHVARDGGRCRAPRQRSSPSLRRCGWIDDLRLRRPVRLVAGEPDPGGEQRRGQHLALRPELRPLEHALRQLRRGCRSASSVSADSSVYCWVCLFCRARAV